MAWGSFAKMVTGSLPGVLDRIVTIPQLVSKNKVLKHLPGMDAINAVYDKLWEPQVDKMNQGYW